MVNLTFPSLAGPSLPSGRLGIRLKYSSSRGNGFPEDERSLATINYCVLSILYTVDELGCKLITKEREKFLAFLMRNWLLHKRIQLGEAVHTLHYPSPLLFVPALKEDHQLKVRCVGEEVHWNGSWGESKLLYKLNVKEKNAYKILGMLYYS